MIPVAGRTDREKQFYAMWADLLDILRQYNGETHQDDNTVIIMGVLTGSWTSGMWSAAKKIWTGSETGAQWMTCGRR